MHVCKHMRDFTLRWCRVWHCQSGFGSVKVLCSVPSAQSKPTSHAGTQAQSHSETEMCCFCLGKNSRTTAIEPSL